MNAYSIRYAILLRRLCVWFPPGLGLAGLALVALQCAGQMPPPGGPIDTTPPTIVWTSPDPYTLHFEGQEIGLEFDEYVDRNSVQNAVFISPDVGPLTFNWSGHEVTIGFEDTLRRNTTYVVTVGTDVVDLHNRNRMAHAFALAFSTGGTIDPGFIQGKVYPIEGGDELSGIMVFAYRLAPGEADTLNAMWTKPDYATQSGVDGSFELAHLALGAYRLVAVKDQYRNLLYDPEADQFGVPAYGLSLTTEDTLLTHVTMQLALEDTTAPRLIKVSPLTRRLLKEEFSEAIDSGSVHLRNVIVLDTLSGARIPVLSARVLFPKQTEIMVATEPMDSGRGYRAVVSGVWDLAGNTISTLADAMPFTAVDSLDTSAVDVKSVSVQDSSLDLSLQPSVVAVWTRPLARPLDPDVVSMTDSSGRTVPLRISRQSNIALEVGPLRDLAGKTWYILRIHGGRVRDVFGGVGKDTVRVIRFQTLDPDALSSIEGTVADERESDAIGPIHVRAEEVSGPTATEMEVILPAAGVFTLPQIREGRYVLSAYRDRNDNGMFDPGRVYPFEPSERFVVYADTLTVRARWPLEGVVLRLR